MIPCVTDWLSTYFIGVDFSFCMMIGSYHLAACTAFPVSTQTDASSYGLHMPTTGLFCCKANQPATA